MQIGDPALRGCRCRRGSACRAAARRPRGPSRRGRGSCSEPAARERDRPLPDRGRELGAARCSRRPPPCSRASVEVELVDVAVPARDARAARVDDDGRAAPVLPEVGVEQCRPTSGRPATSVGAPKPAQHEPACAVAGVLARPGEALAEGAQVASPCGRDDTDGGRAPAPARAERTNGKQRDRKAGDSAGVIGETLAAERLRAAYFLPSSSSTARKASWGTSILPTCFIRLLPVFCFSSSLRLRVTSPP